MRLRGASGRPLALGALNRYVRRYGQGGVADLQDSARTLARCRPSARPSRRCSPDARSRRMPRDIDILGRSFSGDEAATTRQIAAIAAVESDDGVAFDPASLSTVPIRQDDEYHGLRLAMAAILSRVKLKLQLDVSLGDPVTPGPRASENPTSTSSSPGTGSTETN